MNIMLVSVTERTREIGIRKAIGADAATSSASSWVEAIFLSLSGGVLGVGVGFIGTQFEHRRHRAGGRPVFDLLALGVSLVIGLVFGLYPASRAADLRPIDALRYE